MSRERGPVELLYTLSSIPYIVSFPWCIPGECVGQVHSQMQER